MRGDRRGGGHRDGSATTTATPDTGSANHHSANEYRANRSRSKRRSEGHRDRLFEGSIGESDGHDRHNRSGGRRRNERGQNRHGGRGSHDGRGRSSDVSVDCERSGAQTAPGKEAGVDRHAGRIREHVDHAGFIGGPGNDNSVGVRAGVEGRIREGAVDAVQRVRMD
jgi:hypothetical protein